MSKQLAAVRRATNRRRGAEELYRSKILAAREAGHTLSEIADAAGLGVTGVRYLLHPDPRKERKT